MTVGGQQVSTGDACIGTSHAPSPRMGSMSKGPESPSVFPFVSKSPRLSNGDRSDDTTHGPFEGRAIFNERDHMHAD